MFTRHFPRVVAVPTLVVAAMSAASPAAAVVGDARGDFLASYEGPRTEDLDVAAAAVLLDGDIVQFGGVMFDRIGISPDTRYVWGIDRGAGTPGLLAGSPPLGAGVLFDAVLQFRADGSGQLIAFDDSAPATFTEFAAGTIGVFGSVSIARIPLALLPSRGFAPTQYRFNLWTRGGDGNSGIADFAVRRTFAVEGVPEPASWALLVIGFGLVGASLRRGAAVPA